MTWFRISNARKPDPVDVDIFDEIGGFGVTAAQFVRELRAVDSDSIRLHVNSPGGDVFQGVAILNALRAHPARIVATVEGVAASAASFVTMAADEVVMARNSEMMIHDAAGVAVGNADTMADLARRLDKVSNNIASIYAERTGGSVEQWRAAMKAETWYSADEAVEAGLADRVEAAVPEDVVAEAKARFDLSIYNFAGRAAAPDPRVGLVPVVDEEPAVTAVGGVDVRGAGMDPAKLREAVGLPADASDDEVRAQLTGSGLVPAPAAAPVAEKKTEVPPLAEELPFDPTLMRRIVDGEVVVMDPANLAELKRRANLGVEAHIRLQEQECERVLNEAVAVGKFPPARLEHWKAMWQADPEGTRQAVKNLHPGIVPLTATGYANSGDDFRNDALYVSLYGEGS